MANIIDTGKFIKTDAVNNNNKFWEYTFYDNNTYSVEYGRVGVTCNSEDPKPTTQQKLNTKIKAKERDGYVRVAVIADAALNIQVMSNEHAKKIAEEELAADNPVLKTLIQKLATANKHQLSLATGGQMDIDLKTGVISTPLGVITSETVVKARTVLSELEPLIAAKDFDCKSYVEKINQYLTLVPQKVSHAKGWHRSFFLGSAALLKQGALLDQLESSVELVSKRLEAAKNAGEQSVSKERQFNVKLSIIEDGLEIDRIIKYYKSTAKAGHASAKLRPIAFYSVDIESMSKAFEQFESMQNRMELWHGTRVGNALSLLKRGFVLPGQISSAAISGAMFGNGCYFSDQSTKSLNYAYGYWDSSAKDDNCFMFLNQVAMGNIYYPRSPFRGLPPSGYDSTFAEAGTSGVINNEMIVYNTAQIKPTHLIEFGL